MDQLSEIRSAICRKFRMIFVAGEEYIFTSPHPPEKLETLFNAAAPGGMLMMGAVVAVSVSSLEVGWRTFFGSRFGGVKFRGIIQPSGSGSTIKGKFNDRLRTIVSTAIVIAFFSSSISSKEFFPYMIGLLILLINAFLGPSFNKATEHRIIDFIGAVCISGQKPAPQSLSD